MVQVFAVPIFFITFRETLETSIIVSVLLAFLKQTLGNRDDPKTYKRLVWQVWIGSAVGLLICLIIGAGMIGAFYGLDRDRWSDTEDIWEGVFALVASIVITLMGAALLRVSKLQAKWRVKLAKALEAKDQHGGRLSQRFKHWAEKYAMFLLPFITVLREGLEAVVFIAGVGLGLEASSIPLPAIVGIFAGCFVGYLIYKGTTFAPIQFFLILSTCFLYLVAAGLFSRSVWYFEMNKWNGIIGGDAAETGSGPGSYDIRKSVWHVNCCNPEINGGGGWGIFNALFGWQNSATIGSVVSYNLYWLAVISGFLAMIYYEKKGHWPLTKAKPISGEFQRANSESDSQGGGVVQKKHHTAGAVSTNVRSVEA